MKIIETLKKLIAHEESARSIGNTAEAEAFAVKIQTLLSKHNLSMSEVEIQAASDSPIDLEPVKEEFSTIEDWQRMLLKEIAEINGCYPLEHQLGVQIVVGRRQDREIVIRLFLYFEKLGREMAEKYQNDNWNYFQEHLFFSSAFTPRSEDNKVSRHSFLLGFASSVSLRLKEMQKIDEQQTSTSSALVFLGNRHKDNQEWINQKLNVTKNEGRPNKVDRSAFERGANAGESIALTDKSLK